MPDDSFGLVVIDLLIISFLVFVNAFFSATEMAVITANDNQIRKLAREGNRSARRVVGFIENPSRFFAVIQVGVTLAGFLSSAFAADKFAGRLAYAIDPGGSIAFLRTISMVVVTVILSYFSLVLGELVPKRLAQKYPERIAFIAAGIIKAIGGVLKPFVAFLTLSTNGVLRLLRIDPHAKNRKVTEEEIRMMIDVGSEAGSIEDQEKQMIQNIFEFNDKEVSEIMTHRTKIVSLPVEATYKEVLRVAKEERYTRIPVYHDTIDDILGILHIKDLLGYTEENGNADNFSLADIMRPPLVVPETKNLSALFREMQKGHMQLAVIVDEYGGTSGIATIEDMLEEIVGNITDEFDEEEEKEIEVLQDGDILVLGNTTLNDIRDHLKIEFPDEDYDTIAGLVIDLLDRIPEPDEMPVVTYKNLDIRVVELEDNWISKVQIHVRPLPELPKNEADDNAEA